MNRLTAAFAAAACVAAYAGPNDSNWVQLLREGDTGLSDWFVKIQGSALGANPHNSFHYATAPDGHSPRLEVTDTVTWSSSYGYGHIFYKKPFSDYLLRAQFHFTDKKSYAIANGGWTIQNNGLMLHCQSPQSMGVGQDYPNSIEDQLLGYWSGTGGGTPNVRSSNVCVPGVTINYQGKWYSDGTGHHCTNAKFHSLLYDSSVAAGPGANSTNANWPGRDVWQYALARVIDSTSMTFWVRNRPDTAWDSVMGFTGIHSGQAASETNLGSAKPLTGGYIALQMEGTSTEFAKIELLNLVGCMDKKDSAYRAYFVRDSAAACSGVTGIFASQAEARSIFHLDGALLRAESEILDAEVFDLKGARLLSLRGEGTSVLPLAALKPGLYGFKVRTRKGTAQAVCARM